MTHSAFRWGAVVAALVAGGCSGEDVTQPIAFNHRLHAGKRAIPCTDCHLGARNAAQAGLPSLRQCLACHVRPQGDPPSRREQTVRDLAAKGTFVKFNPVTRNEGHVHFSHAAHTTLGRMACRQCHGDVRRWSVPPVQPNEDLEDMDICMDCHRRKGASTDCTTCHK